MCMQVRVETPRKPNSGLRKTARVLLSTGKVISVYIPGGSHSLSVHSAVLVRGGRCADVPGWLVFSSAADHRAADRLAAAHLAADHLAADRLAAHLAAHVAAVAADVAHAAVAADVAVVAAIAVCCYCCYLLLLFAAICCYCCFFAVAAFTTITTPTTAAIAAVPAAAAAAVAAAVAVVVCCSNYKAVRGVYDLLPVKNRSRKRSKYGCKMSTEKRDRIEDRRQHRHLTIDKDRDIFNMFKFATWTNKDNQPLLRKLNSDEEVPRDINLFNKAQRIRRQRQKD